MGWRISNQELIDDIHRLAEQVGDTPTLNEYRKHGQYGAQTLYDRFGSWNKALEASGFESRQPNQKVPQEDLIEELQRLAVELDESPTREQMNNKGQYWGSTYIDRFGNWSSALEAANLKPRRKPKRSREELIEGLRNLAAQLGERPTAAQMADMGEYPPRTYYRKFGSWNEALEVAGFEPRLDNNKLSREVLLIELRRLADKLGKRPRAQDMDAEGRYASSTYQKHFGKWSIAVKEAFDNSEINN